MLAWGSDDNNVSCSFACVSIATSVTVTTSFCWWLLDACHSSGLSKMTLRRAIVSWEILSRVGLRWKRLLKRMFLLIVTSPPLCLIDTAQIPQLKPLEASQQRPGSVVGVSPADWSLRAWLVMADGGSCSVYVAVVDGVVGLVLLLVM